MHNKLGAMEIPENFIASESSTCIPNPVLLKMRLFTHTIYGIMLVTGVFFLITYAILWSKIQPPLDLFEAGNAWTFILFLASCGTTTAIALIITILRFMKFRLRWNHIFGLDLLLIFCWACLFMVMLGAMEHIQDRSRCNEPGVKCTKRSAPKTPTPFGIYIAGVCGNNLTESDIKPVPTLVDKDDLKCEATSVLKIEIFCMYIWTIELMVISILELVFGVGNCKYKNAPEFVSAGSLK